MTPDIALAASARDWPDRVHRFLLDHGGGRAVDRIMGADQATRADFDVLLIDDVCSFLTPRLVALLKQSGREVIGVYLPEDGPDAKRHLLECGISDVIESGASPEEFLSKVLATLAHRVSPAPDESAPHSTSFRIGVTGPCEGVGMTETSIALAFSLSRQVETVLVDMDPIWPSVAQRLDLAPHPNIRTALDHALHRIDRLDEAIARVSDLMVVGGRADGGQGPDIRRADMLMLMDALGSHADVLVADLGPLDGFEEGLVREFDAIILVGTATPVGVTRLIRSVGSLLAAHPSKSLLAVVNKAPKGSFKRGEIVTEIGRSFPDLPVVLTPHDQRLEQAAWDGALGVKGRYGRAFRAVSDLVVRSVL